jgi:riboflavin synthase
MFTGIIEATSTVSEVHLLKNSDGVQSMTLEFAVPSSWQVKLGDSIAVNGACLTAAAFPHSSPKPQDSVMIRFDVSEETLKITNLGGLKAGSLINLERAMALGDRLDGHLVSGHIDTVGKVLKLEDKAQREKLVHIVIPSAFRPLVILKGSMALNGISLTINSIEDRADQDSVLGFWIIPTTLEKSNLSNWREQDLINIEFDMLGKYFLRSQSLQQAHSK